MPTLLTRRLLRLSMAVAGVTAAVVTVAVPPADAATFAVTNTNGSGPGSLSQAVADANLAPGADTISFAVTGTIRPEATLVVNGGPLAIVGPGPALLTVSGNGTKRILTQSTSTYLAVSGLTLADGSTGSGGGAILNFGGTVAVSETVFVRNSAFAGGAIENTNGGTLTITSSTFSGNSGLPGGAIANNRSALTITNSTFVGNSAVVGGAIFNLNAGTIRVTNTTFSGNTASVEGPALHTPGGLPITVGNSLFADNGCVGPIIDAGGNLDWPDSACPGVAADPRLGQLADNGGPTPTIALGLGSAAIDAALSSICPATDQRGVARPFGAGCDTGAYESDVLDVVPPVITIPARIVAHATGPDGATLSYSASAIDDVDGPVTVVCVPSSGATFPIGTTTVTCEASDASGNTASASFDVLVKGAEEQLVELIAVVAGIGPGSSLGDKLIAAHAALDEGEIDDACEILGAFVQETSAQSGKKLTPADSAALGASATRVRSVLSC